MMVYRDVDGVDDDGDNLRKEREVIHVAYIHYTYALGIYSYLYILIVWYMKTYNYVW